MNFNIKDLRIIQRALILLAVKQAYKVEKMVALVAKVKTPQQLKHLQYKLTIAKINMDETEKVRDSIREIISQKKSESES